MLNIEQVREVNATLIATAGSRDRRSMTLNLIRPRMRAKETGSYPVSIFLGNGVALDYVNYDNGEFIADHSFCHEEGFNGAVAAASSLNSQEGRVIHCFQLLHGEVTMCNGAGLVYKDTVLCSGVIFPDGRIEIIYDDLPDGYFEDIPPENSLVPYAWTAHVQLGKNNV